MPDSWRIPGPIFLVTYAVLVVLALLAAIVTWHRIAPRHLPDPGPELSPSELAMVARGRSDAVVAALTFLRTSGAINVRRRGRGFRLRRPPAAGKDPLADAVYRALAVDPWQPVARLTRRRDVSAALTGMAADLRRRGFLEPPRFRWFRSVCVLWFVPVLSLGAIRELAGGKQTWLLELLLIATVLLIVFGAFRSTRPRTTSAAESAVRSAAFAVPRPSGAGWRPVGRAHAAIAVALYGAAVTWQTDPALAVAVAAKSALPSADQTNCSTDDNGPSYGGGACGGGGGCGGGGS